METNHALANVARLYRMYANEFVTVGGFADWLGTSDSDALIIIEQGRQAHNLGY